MDIIIKDEDKQASLGRFIDLLEAVNPLNPRISVDVVPGETPKERVLLIKGFAVELTPLFTHPAANHIAITRVRLLKGVGSAGVMAIHVKLLNS